LTDHKNVLYFLALHAAPVRKNRIQEFCSYYGELKAPAVNTIVNKLKQNGWIDIDEKGMLQCKSEYREPIVHQLCADKNYGKYVERMFSAIGGRYFIDYSYARGYGSSEKRSWDRPKLPGDFVRELRHLLISNQTNSLSELFGNLESREYYNIDVYPEILTLFKTYEGRNWLNEANIEFRSRLLQHLLVRTLSQLRGDFDDTWNILIGTGCDPKCEPATQILILDYAFITGKLDEPKLAGFSGKGAPLLLSAHRAFVCGCYADAAEAYQLALKSFGNLKAVKNAVLPFLSGIFQALVELKRGNTVAVLENAKSVQARSGSVSRGIKIECNMNIEGAWRLIETIAERMMGKSPNQLLVNTKDLLPKRPVWLSILLSAHESKWFQRALPVTTGEWMEQFLWQTKTGIPWITAEIAELCESLDIAKDILAPFLEKAEEYRTQTETVPLRDLFAPKEDWERWLESLQVLANEAPKSPKKSAAPKKEQPKARLIWRLIHEVGGYMDFIPHEQKWSPKTNSWLAEKEITMSRLFKSQNTLGYLTEQDKRICSKIKVSASHYAANRYSFGDEIAAEFVGHPLLFLETERKTKKTVRIELIHARPEISMEEKGGKLHVAFSPPLKIYHNVHNHGAYGQYGNPDDSKESFFIVKESATRFKVIKLTKTEMQIRVLLGEKGRVFPKKAQDPLAALLGKLASDMSVKTDANVEFTDVPSIPANTKMYIHLSPYGEGIQADFFVRPLGAESSGHRPGMGSERLLGEVDGRNVQTIRALPAEKNCRADIIARFPAFQHGSLLTEDQYLFESPSDALALLAELKDSQREENAPDFELYWSHGEKYSVTSTASFGNFSLSFMSMEDWLSASGTLNVDGEAFELQKLFALLDDNSESRFVKLSEQKFLALTKEFRKRLGELKQLSHIKGKTVQIHPLAAAGMEDFFDAIPTLQKDALWCEVKKRITTAHDYKAPFPKNFVGDPRDYQLDGYRWLARCAEWGVGCCLADDMGLGKTIQALMLLLLRAERGPALVVAPTSVCFNWEREAAKFAPTLKIKRVQSITGTGASKKERDKLIASAKKREVLITSYTLLQQEINLFAKKKYATVILDESQAIKNPDSNRAKAAAQLQAEFRIAMTGTPIENHLTELWSLFRFLNPGLLGSQNSFEDRFAVPIQRDHSASSRNTLRRLVHPFILRRTKSQVLEELPARTEIIREIELSKEELALYEAARLNALKELQEMKETDSGKSRLQILAALTRLRQLCCNPKMVLPDSKVESSKLEAFREIMEELKANRHRVLVFSQFVKHLEILKAELDAMDISYQYLDGSTPERERQKRVEAFQSGESDAFLISIKAGGSGLNLTAADYVIHTDPWWNPAVEDQATDRAHRIGQTRPVTVYRLITQGTIEEKIVRLHHEKRDIADKLLEGTDQATKLSAADLIDILRS